MSDDTFNDHLSAMKDHSHEHMGHWVEHQKMIFKKWRKIIEERAEDDKDFFKQWSKSWMEPGSKCSKCKTNPCKWFNRHVWII